MNVIRSLLTNTTAWSFTQLVNRLGSAVFWVLVVRTLGTESLGTLSFALSLFGFFVTLSALGLGPLVGREVPRHPDRAGLYFSHALILGLVMTFVFIPLMLAVAWLTNVQADTRYVVLLMSISLIPASGFHWSKILLNAAEKSYFIALSETSENVVKLAAGAWILARGGDIRYVALAILAAKIISCLLGFVLASRYAATPRWQLDRTILKDLVRNVPSFTFIGISHSLFWAVTVVLLTHLAGEKAAGIYSAAFKLIHLIVTLGGAYGLAFFPIAARLSINQIHKVERMVNDSVNYLFIIMSAIAVGGFVLADKIVDLVYGSAAGPVVDVFQILIWLVIPLSMVMILGYALVTFNLQRFDLYANITACVTVVISNLLLIPEWGAAGGALAFLLGGTVFCGIEAFYVSRALFRLRFYKAFWIAIAGVLLMALLVSQVKSLGLGLGVLSGALFYLLYLWLTSSVPVIHFRNRH